MGRTSEGGGAPSAEGRSGSAKVLVSVIDGSDSRSVFHSGFCCFPPTKITPASDYLIHLIQYLSRFPQLARMEAGTIEARARKEWRQGFSFRFFDTPERVIFGARSGFEAPLPMPKQGRYPAPGPPTIGQAHDCDPFEGSVPGMNKAASRVCSRRITATQP